jgi:nitroreductase/dihydropteridine reductase
MINLSEMVSTEHLTKLFDGRPVDDSRVHELLQLIHSAPSSCNLQPGHFVVAKTPASRERIAKAMVNGYDPNLPKVRSASHVIVFCCRTDVPQDYVEELVRQHYADGKFTSPKNEKDWRWLIDFARQLHEGERHDMSSWLKMQVYLALGIALLGAAHLDVDVCPLEGFSPQILDAELGLTATGYTSIVLLAIGHRSTDDYAIGTPKARLPFDRVVTHLDD